VEDDGGGRKDSFHPEMPMDRAMEEWSGRMEGSQTEISHAFLSTRLDQIKSSKIR
jgi:hypothetical protein